jgi:hypothetical protein
MAVKGEFYRSGQAYLLDNGARMRAGVPRFEPGNFANARALRIERGTTNLLSANQSNVETDSTGFSVISGATGAKDSTYYFEGAASFKINFSATSASGYQVIVTTATQGTYIGRLRMRGDTVSYPNNSLQYHLRIVYTDATLDESVSIVTPNATWQNLVSQPVASNGAKTVSSVALMVRSVGTLLDTYSVWIDALQIEALTYATTWHIGAATRNGERCLVPATALFDPAAGTVEAWIWCQSIASTRIIFDTRHLGDGLISNNKCILRLTDPGTLNFYYWNGSALRTLAGGTVSAGAWTHVAASWSSTGGKVYRNGALIASHADLPALVAVPRINVGGRADGADMLNGLLSGLRFTRGRARTDADILAAYNSNVQFTEDGDDTTVFSFDGTLRSLLPARMIQVAPESSFLVPTTVTASTSATNFPASNSADYEFPLRSHRTTTTAQATLTFDFGDVVNFRAAFVALGNWEWGKLEISYDGVTYVAVSVSPFACDVDADQYRKWGNEINASGRYARVTIPVQQIDAGAGYFETPLVIFTDDLDALAANPNWGANLNLAYPYESGDAGAHDEVQARGKQYVTMQVRAQSSRTRSTEWLQLMALGNHRKFLLFANLGNPAESYLMRSEGSVQWEEQAGYNAISMTWREHIN